MKKIFITLSLFIAFFAFIFISPAGACHFCEVEISADCEGYTVSGSVEANWLWHEGFTVSYNLQVTADGFGTIPVYEFATVIVDSDVEDDLCVPFEFNGVWDQEFCGDVTITGTAHVESITDDDYDDATLEQVDLVCPCLCTRTPGYWKNPKKLWPVEQLTIGGVVYSRTQLIDILQMDARGGNTPLKLFHHLVAAMLNVIMEPDLGPSIQETIDAANAYFLVGVYNKDYAGALKDILDYFNNSGEEYCE